MEKKPLCTFDDKENEKKRRKKFKNVFESIKKGIAVMLYHTDVFPTKEGNDVNDMCTYTSKLGECGKKSIDIIRKKYNLNVRKKKIKKRKNHDTDINEITYELIPDLTKKIGIKSLQKYLTNGSMIGMTMPENVTNHALFAAVVVRSKRSEDKRKKKVQSPTES